MSESVKCPKCGSGMIENIANPGVYVCPHCHNVVDTNVVNVFEEKEELPEEEIKEEHIEQIDVIFPIYDYDDNDGLVFYEKAPSFEDVFPYLDNELLVCCDGSGGAGGFYHEVPSSRLNSLEKIKHIVLPEDKNGCLDSYLKLIFKPIIEEKGPISKRTSAFWASRIVMPRFIFAWKAFNRDIEKARQFVLEGMDRVIDLLDFESSNKSDKAILPTTFVAIAVNKEDDKKVDIDVYWAGDSRAYYFSKNGLQQLSIDDEKSTGEITNLFSRKKGFNTTINKRSYSLDKPCLLFTCSDGIFDIFPDSLNLESNLLALLMKVNSMNEYTDILGDYYRPILNDDCTIAMKKFGYPDFSNMKEDFKERFALDSRLYFKQREMSDAYDVKNDPSLYNGVIKRLASRARDIYPSLLKELIRAISNNEKDVIFNGEFDSKIIQPYQKKLMENNELYKNKKKEVVEEVRKYLISNAKNIYIEEVLEEESIPNELKPLFLEIQTSIDKLRDYESGMNEYNELLKKIENSKKEIYDSLIEVISEGINFIPGIGIQDIGILSSKYNKFKDLLKGEPSEELKEYFLKIGRYHLIEELIALQKDANELKGGMEEVDVNATLDNITNNINELFKADYQTLYTILESSDDSFIKEKVTTLNNEINSRQDERLLEEEINRVFSGDDGNRYFIIHRLESGKNPSIFDRFFNPSVLNQAFTYHNALKLLDGEELKLFTEEYNAYEANALKLIS